MLLVEARVLDSTHLELSSPITVNRGRTVLVALTESAEQDAERRQWLEGAAACLEAAYGDSEPDYDASMVREANPEYST